MSGDTAKYYQVIVRGLLGELKDSINRTMNTNSHEYDPDATNSIMIITLFHLVAVACICMHRSGGELDGAAWYWYWQLDLAKRLATGGLRHGHLFDTFISDLLFSPNTFPAFNYFTFTLFLSSCP